MSDHKQGQTKQEQLDAYRVDDKGKKMTTGGGFVKSLKFTIISLEFHGNSLKFTR